MIWRLIIRLLPTRSPQVRLKLKGARVRREELLVWLEVVGAPEFRPTNIILYSHKGIGSVYFGYMSRDEAAEDWRACRRASSHDLSTQETYLDAQGHAIQRDHVDSSNGVPWFWSCPCPLGASS